MRGQVSALKVRSFFGIALVVAACGESLTFETDPADDAGTDASADAPARPREDAGSDGGADAAEVPDVFVPLPPSNPDVLTCFGTVAAPCSFAARRRIETAAIARRQPTAARPSSIAATRLPTARLRPGAS